MQTAVTSKYQITIPKSIRELLGIKKHDKVVWEVKNKSILIKPRKSSLLDFAGEIDASQKNIVEDPIENIIAQNYHETISH